MKTRKMRDDEENGGEDEMRGNEDEMRGNEDEMRGEGEEEEEGPGARLA